MQGGGQVGDEGAERLAVGCVQALEVDVDPGVVLLSHQGGDGGDRTAHHAWGVQDKGGRLISPVPVGDIGDGRHDAKARGTQTVDVRRHLWLAGPILDHDLTVTGQPVNPG